MKKHLLLLSFIFLFGVFKVNAATHTIIFGGAEGFNYAPSTLNALIGDEIIFQGNFGSHPLVSVSVPSGASSFTNTSGSADFSYIVSIAGNYNYQCNFHGSSGMVGSFTVEDPLNIKPLTRLNTEVTLYPNPSSDFVNINMSASSNNSFANIYSVNGTIVKTVNLGANGINKISMDDLKVGIYLVQITNNVDFNQNIRFIKQ